MNIVSYLEQLRQAADQKGLDLRQAFIAAGLNTSAYYRALKGTSLRFSTANRIMQAIRSS